MGSYQKYSVSCFFYPTFILFLDQCLLLIIHSTIYVCCMHFSVSALYHPIKEEKLRESKTVTVHCVFKRQPRMVLTFSLRKSNLGISKNFYKKGSLTLASVPSPHLSFCPPLNEWAFSQHQRHPHGSTRGCASSMEWSKRFELHDVIACSIVGTGWTHKSGVRTHLVISLCLGLNLHLQPSNSVSNGEYRLCVDKHEKESGVGESFSLRRPSSATLQYYLPGLPYVLLCGESEFNEVG
jgi:hypothetical protein